MVLHFRKWLPRNKSLIQAKWGKRIYSSVGMQNISFLKRILPLQHFLLSLILLPYLSAVIFEVVFVHYNHTILAFLSCSIAVIFIDQNKTGHLEHSCPLFAWNTHCRKVSFPDGIIIHSWTNLHSHKSLHTSQEKAVIEYYDMKITEDVDSTCRVKMPFPDFSPKSSLCTMQIRWALQHTLRALNFQLFWWQHLQIEELQGWVEDKMGQV